MPFRSKLKKAFGRSESTSEAPPATGGGTDAGVSEAVAKKEKSAKKHRWNQKSKEWDNWPEHLYKPYEIPQPKYKRPPAKEHTKNLEKFTWDSGAHEDDRRASATSQYSPMGSRLQSRRSSGVGPDGEPLGDAADPIDGVDPNEADGGPLAKAETVKPAHPPPAAPAANPPKVSAGAAETPTDAFDSADLTRALTAIKDGHSTAAPVGA